MPRVAKSKPKKASTLTCRGCRTRKIRCDGSQPSCGICAAYHNDCVYDKPPPMTQIVAMADKIAELEGVIQQLRDENRHKTTAPKPHSLPSEPAPTSLAPTKDSGLDNMAASLDGIEAYYDTTSAVHVPETVLQKTPASEAQPSECYSNLPHRDLSLQDSANVGQIDFWEQTIIENGAAYLGLPRETIRHLLTIHWTWIHGLFMFVPRAILLQDAASNGGFFSPLLLAVICLHSTRFTDTQYLEVLAARSKIWLSQEIHMGPSVPLVQALLQYSAHEMGRGSVSQAWLYSGMAFRIAIDLGIFTELYHDRSNRQEARQSQGTRQLAWSCFLWDQTVSLYLGRTPTFSEPPKWEPNPPPVDEKYEMWRPYTGNDSSDLAYSKIPAHTTACFTNFCKLTVVINEILLNIYGNRRTKQILSFVQKAQQKLQRWRSSSPEYLRVDPDTKSYHSHHIFSQNMLYHTTIILLHRPFRGNSTCRIACREAAKNVVGLLLVMERCYGLSRVTYTMAYCAYTAATVAVQDTKHNIPDAHQRLSTCIRALNAVRASCPGIQRSIDLIYQCIDPEVVQQINNDQLLGAKAAPPVPETFEHMPAFPLQNSMNADSNLFSSSFSHLDSFPQEWFNFTDDILAQFSFESPRGGPLDVQAGT